MINYLKNYPWIKLIKLKQDRLLFHHELNNIYFNSVGNIYFILSIF